VGELGVVRMLVSVGTEKPGGSAEADDGSRSMAPAFGLVGDEGAIGGLGGVELAEGEADPGVAPPPKRNNRPSRLGPWLGLGLGLAFGFGSSPRPRPGPMVTISSAGATRVTLRKDFAPGRIADLLAGLLPSFRQVEVGPPSRSTSHRDDAVGLFHGGTAFHD